MKVMAQFPVTRDDVHDLRFQAMFEGAAIGIGICQLDGRILEANSALSRMLGYDPQELTGTQVVMLDSECDRQLWARDLAPDGRLLGELMRGKRNSFEIEKHYRRKDGSELWGHLMVSLARDVRREPAFLIEMLSDASERRRMEELLRQAEKMEVIGRLAGGIAHDFNNLLTGILLYCDLLSAGLVKGGFSNGVPAELGGTNFNDLDVGAHELETRELSRHVEEVRMAGEQGAALTKQLLAIARKQAAEPHPIWINEIVASAKNLLQRLIGEQIELVVALDSALDEIGDSDAGLVLADPAQLRQILLNVVLNARDAMPRGGKIRLSTRAAEFPDAEIAEKSSINGRVGASRRAISLAVQDNGCGMDTETRTRLFEPFFTTKKPGAGTGLGLATVQRIVSEAGGVIEVQSELGKGTLIEVFLPVLDCRTCAPLSS